MNTEKIKKHIKNRQHAIINNYDRLKELRQLPDCDLKFQKIEEEKTLLKENETRLHELEDMIK